MKSTTKVRLNTKDFDNIVRKFLRVQNGISQVMELEDGHRNSVYCIGLRDISKDIVLKVAPEINDLLYSYETRCMENEIEAYKIISKNTEIPIPELIGFDFSHKVINNNYIILSKLEGVTWSKIKLMLSEEQNNILYRELGKFCSELHSINGTYFGFFSTNKSECYSTWKSAFLKMVESILDDIRIKRIPLPVLPKEILNVFYKKANVLDEVTTPTLVSYDLWEGNILLQKKQEVYHISGVLDFEKAFWGDPLIDFLPSVAFLSDIRKQKAFLEGYGWASKVISDHIICRLNMYRVYLCLRIILESNRYEEKNEIARMNIYTHYLAKCLKKVSMY